MSSQSKGVDEQKDSQQKSHNPTQQQKGQKLSKIKKNKNYKKVSELDKQQFVDNVVEKNYSLSKAAQISGINYSNAKAIFRTYKQKNSNEQNKESSSNQDEPKDLKTQKSKNYNQSNSSNLKNQEDKKSQQINRKQQQQKNDNKLENLLEKDSQKAYQQQNQQFFQQYSNQDQFSNKKMNQNNIIQNLQYLQEQKDINDLMNRKNLTNEIKQKITNIVCSDKLSYFQQDTLEYIKNLLDLLDQHSDQIKEQSKGFNELIQNQQKILKNSINNQLNNQLLQQFQMQNQFNYEQKNLQNFQNNMYQTQQQPTINNINNNFNVAANPNNLLQNQFYNNDCSGFLVNSDNGIFQQQSLSGFNNYAQGIIGNNQNQFQIDNLQKSLQQQNDFSKKFN